jgi:hypothetical protein
MQCNAKAKSSGEQCRRRAVAGRNVCTVHGGKTPRGPAHPNYKHGKHSKVLPAHMREGYERAITDEELVSLRAELAVIDARVRDLLKRADAGDSGKRWKELQAQMKRVDTCRPEEQLLELDTLSTMIRAGTAEASVWHEIRDWFVVREKLTRSERRRLVEAKLVMSVEQAQLVMTMFVDAAKEAVGHDERAMAKIVEAFVRLSGLVDASDVTDGAIEAGGRSTSISQRPDG